MYIYYIFSLGLITNEGYVKCTIKEFNDYRQWIRKLKLDAMDQNWRLQQLAEGATDKKVRNSEAAALTKQRQERAKELYEKKMKKKEKERRRFVIKIFNCHFHLKSYKPPIYSSKNTLRVKNI